MDYLQILFAIVQGITEFFPVSSTGHLVLLQHVLGSYVPQDPETLEGVSLFLHLFSIPIIYFVFREEIQEYRGPRSKEAYYLLITVLPGGIGGMLVSKTVTVSSSLLFLSVGFQITALLLFLTISFFPRYNGFQSSTSGRQSIELMGWKGAFFIGIIQVPAVFPGISRLGMALCGAIIAGLRGRTLVRYSLVAGVPLLLGQAFMSIEKIAGFFNEFSPILTILAILITLGCGIAAIHVLLWLVRKKQLSWICIYLLLLGGSLFWMV